MQVGWLVARLHGPALHGATLLYNARNTSPPSASASPPLSGSWGERLRLSLLRPALGPAAGGGAVTLFGRGFGRLASPLAPRIAVCVWGGWDDPIAAFALSHTIVTAEVDGDAVECLVPPFAAAPPALASALPPALPPMTPIASASSVNAYDASASKATAAGGSVAADVATGSIATGNIALRVALLAPTSLPSPLPLPLPAALAAALLGGSSQLSAPLRYGYYAALRVGFVGPIAGPWRGGTRISIHASSLGLSPAHGLPAAWEVGREGGEAGSAGSARHQDASPLCRFGAGASALLVRATWVGAGLASCLAPPWRPALWGTDPVRLSALPLALLSNGRDVAGYYPRLAHGHTATTPQPHATYSHLVQSLSSVSPQAGPRASGWWGGGAVGW